MKKITCVFNFFGWFFDLKNHAITGCFEWKFNQFYQKIVPLRWVVLHLMFLGGGGWVEMRDQSRPNLVLCHHLWLHLRKNYRNQRWHLSKIWYRWLHIFLHVSDHLESNCSFYFQWKFCFSELKNFAEKSRPAKFWLKKEIENGFPNAKFSLVVGRYFFLQWYYTEFGRDWSMHFFSFTPPPPPWNIRSVRPLMAKLLLLMAS